MTDGKAETVETKVLWNDWQRSSVQPWRGAALPERSKPSEIWTHLRDDLLAQNILRQLRWGQERLDGDAAVLTQAVLAVLGSAKEPVGFDDHIQGACALVSWEILEYWAVREGASRAVEALRGSTTIDMVNDWDQKRGESVSWLAPAPVERAEWTDESDSRFPMWQVLRRELAWCPAREYHEAAAQAWKWREATEQIDVRPFISYVFPDQQDWVREDIEAVLAQDGDPPTSVSRLLGAIGDPDLGYELATRITPFDDAVGGAMGELYSYIHTVGAVADRTLLALWTPERFELLEALFMIESDAVVDFFRGLQAQSTTTKSLNKTILEYLERASTR
jgi:hypothetical protein